MPLWGSRYFASGNQKPVFANTANTYGANTSVVGTKKAHHSGWVSLANGTGPVIEIAINHRGGGYNANGYIIFTGGGGTGANASFTAKSNVNNATDNVIISVVLNSGGSGYHSTPVATANLGNSNAATFYVTMGGRAGRKNYETLVAMRSLSYVSGAELP
jgi:hypothetical protein